MQIHFEKIRRCSLPSACLFDRTATTTTHEGHGMLELSDGRRYAFDVVRIYNRDQAPRRGVGRIEYDTELRLIRPGQVSRRVPEKKMPLFRNRIEHEFADRVRELAATL